MKKQFRGPAGSVLKRTHRRVALLVVASGVVVATIGIGSAASAGGPNGQLRDSLNARGLVTAAVNKGSNAAISAFVGAGVPALLQSVSSSLGHPFTFASDSFSMKSWAGIDADQWVIDQWKGSGYQMIWTVPMLPSSGGVSLATGATGAYNGYFTTLAQNLVAAGMGDSVLRIGWEFNQSTYPWYAAGQSTNFVNYWRQIVTAMRSVPGADFSFEWNPSRGDNGPKDAAMGSFVSYYPGDSYVDIVAMDIYDDSWGTYPGAAAEFQTILTQTWGLDWLASFGLAHNKPLAIPEMGLGSGPSAPQSGPVVGIGQVSGGDDATFVTDMLNWITHNDVVNAAYWDFQSSSIQNGQNPLAANALRQGLAEFAGGSSPTGG